MTETKIYTIKVIKAPKIHGQTGHNWGIYDQRGQLVRQGWSGGTKREAIQDAQDTINQLLGK